MFRNVFACSWSNMLHTKSACLSPLVQSCMAGCQKLTSRKSMEHASIADGVSLACGESLFDAQKDLGHSEAALQLYPFQSFYTPPPCVYAFFKYRRKGAGLLTEQVPYCAFDAKECSACSYDRSHPIDRKHLTITRSTFCPRLDCT